MKNKILGLMELADICRRLKKEGKKIAATSGCFDLVHAGHIIYLEEARQKADVLVLLLNSDVSVRKLKGMERPIVPQNERAVVAAGLGCVDYVCLFDELTPCQVIAEFQPDIWVKGGDYAGKHIPEMDVVAPYGGRVEYVRYEDGCSSTNIIEKIKGML